MLFNSGKTFFSTKALLLIYPAIFLISLMFEKISSKRKPREPKLEVAEDFFESRVVELNDANFHLFNTTTPVFYLYFYSTENPKCVKFSAKYDKSSYLAERSEWKVVYAKINIETSPKTAEFYHVKSTPTVFWGNYKENDFHEYHGILAPKSLVNFVNHQLNYTSEELVNWEQLESKKKNGNYLIFVGDIEKFKNQYGKVVKVVKDEDIDVVMWTKSNSLYDRFNVPRNHFDAVVLNKKKSRIEFVSNLNIDENTSPDEIRRLIEIYERQPYEKVDEHTLHSSIEHHPPTPTVILIYSRRNKSQAEYNKHIADSMSKLADKYRREYHFMNVSTSNSLCHTLMVFTNVTEQNIPTLILFNDDPTYTDDVEKYVFPENVNINEKTIEQFLSDYRNKKLQRVLFSDPVPTSAVDDNGILHLVGTTYEDTIFKQTKKDVVLFFYSDLGKKNALYWDIFQFVYRKLKNNTELVFGRINPLFNEVFLIHYEELPSIFVIKGNSYEERLENIVKYETKVFNSTNILQFIKKSVSTPLSSIETTESDQLFYENERKKVLKTKKKEREEEVINFQEHNSGLRRYVRYMMDERDQEQFAQLEDDLKMLEKKKKRYKDDL